MKSRWAASLRSVLLPLLFSSAVCLGAFAEAPPVDRGRLDAMAASFYPAGDPGAAVLLARGDEILLREGYGMASLELGVEIEPEMVFRIGSISKQFTAVAVLMLAERGKLRLDQTISEILPDYPKEQGSRVRIDHLLSHSSGIPGYTENPEFWKNACKDLTAAEMLAFFASQPLQFAPGERFAYSNSGYYLLGMIVEKVSGQSYASFVEQHLFAPAGMKRSLFDDPQKRVPGRVAGYQRLESGDYVPAPYVSPSGAAAAGALASTVDDLRRWNDALLSGKLVSRASLDKAWTPYTFNDGRKSHYGFGWNLGSFHGEKMVHHGGGIHGFITTMYFFPEKRITAVLLSNGNQLDPKLVAQRLAMAAFGQQPDFRKVELSQEALAKFEGVYKVSEKSRRTVRAEGGKLITRRDGSPPVTASPIGPNEFLYDEQNDRLRFELDAQGKVKNMLMLRWGQDQPEEAELTAEKLPELPKLVELPAEDLDRLVGRYQLQPDFILTVRRTGERLVIQATGQSEIAVGAVSATELFAPLVDARLVFELEGGKAKSLTLHQGGQAMPAPRID
jgi:D-alanyl-D-alanine carboxypeptidase